MAIFKHKMEEFHLLFRSFWAIGIKLVFLQLTLMTHTLINFIKRVEFQQQGPSFIISSQSLNAQHHS